LTQGKIVVTGVQGQDGLILAEKLFKEGFDVIGLGRRRIDITSDSGRRLTEMLDAISENKFQYGICDLRESTVVQALIKKEQPMIVYNLAAWSSPAECWDNPVGALSNDTHGVVNILDAIRSNSPQTVLVQACTSGIFGTSKEPISETNSIRANNPYAIAKYASYSICEQYRERYGLHVRNAIMFNHESIDRPEAFVTRRITRGIARIVAGQSESLDLWSISPIRDWGWAEEFMTGFKDIGMLKDDTDLILATEVGASVKDFCELALSKVNLKLEDVIRVRDPLFDSGIDISVGNATKAKKIINWSPKIDWRGIVDLMLKNDLATFGIKI
jgi:GDPmannose 4,6-dehydratase